MTKRRALAWWLPMLRSLFRTRSNDQSSSTASADRRKAEDAVADAERLVADSRSALDKVTADWRQGVHSRRIDAARSALSRAQDRLTEQQGVLAELEGVAPDTPLPTRAEGELERCPRRMDAGAGGP